MTYKNTLEFAQQLDKEDKLNAFRNEFHIPQHEGKDCLYFTGNSLGLQPKRTASFFERELADWKKYGVEGHFHPDKENPWFSYHELGKKTLAKLVGANPAEVVLMNNLTVNLHLLMVSFYRPQGKRVKIIAEGGAFPSDQYALESQIKFHGLNPDNALIELFPRDGEHYLRTGDILAAIADAGDELALVMMSGVQYYTGQFFDLEQITAAAHQVGALAGFDLAHAAGNVPLQLHNWEVDFATWCSYKYLNSGPGGASGIFVHEKHGNSPELPRFAGWWGHQQDERFLMQKGFKPMQGADGWQLSNVNVFGTVGVLASLSLFEEVGMAALREKSLKLTGYMEFLLQELNQADNKIEILTPSKPEERGCQLSLFVKNNGRKVFDAISAAGVVADWREPNVIRVAPVPLYNSFEDVYRFVEVLEKFV